MTELAWAWSSKTRPAASAAAALGLLLVFSACVAAPLATYTATLAMFGLAHVVSEMRYVDHRFGPRLRGGLGLWLAGPLIVAVGARLATMAGLLPSDIGVGVELAAGAALLGVLVVCIRRRRWLTSALAAALLAGAVLAPFHTLLLLAVAHNLTPIAFLAQALEGVRRRQALVVSGVVFLVLPLLIATGLPFAAFSAAGLTAPEATVFAGGPLRTNIGAYVPREYFDAPWALHVFSAAVFAQCMHYVAVIVVLPRLIPGGQVSELSLVRWPSVRTFALGLAAASVAVAAAYALDYAAARRAYALAALLHSWIEIPILMLALGGGAAAATTAGRSAEAA